MPMPRNNSTRDKTVPIVTALPLDIQCWILAVASTLCPGDHRPALSGLTAVRAALVRGDHLELAKALGLLVEDQRENLHPALRVKLNLLLAEIRHSSNRRVRRLCSEVVHLSLCCVRDAS